MQCDREKQIKRNFSLKMENTLTHIETTEQQSNRVRQPHKARQPNRFYFIGCRTASAQ